MLVVIGVVSCGETGDGELSNEDIATVRDVSLAYGTAWRSEDPESVMAIFAADATIIPSGMSPIRGDAAIRAFWFPADSPPTKVTRFESTPPEVSGFGDVAVVTGTFELEFDYDGAAYSSAGTYRWLAPRAGRFANR